MKRGLIRAVLILFMTSMASFKSNASLVGPWFRYQCDELGFQIPVSNGWKVTPVPNGMVFAMQYSPQPYVRLAVGRIEAEPHDIEQMVAAHINHMKSSTIHRSKCEIDGHDAVEIDAINASGSSKDFFVRKGHFCYWIGFSADRSDTWPLYAQTFSIVMDGFRFV